MADEPVFEYSRTGFKFTVFPNRIETESMGAFFKKNRQTVLLKTVTTIEITGLTKQLKLTTVDGKKWEWQLGTKGDEARDAIAALL